VVFGAAGNLSCFGAAAGVPFGCLLSAGFGFGAGCSAGCGAVSAAKRSTRGRPFGSGAVGSCVGAGVDAGAGAVGVGSCFGASVSKTRSSVDAGAGAVDADADAAAGLAAAAGVHIETAISRAVSSASGGPVAVSFFPRHCFRGRQLMCTPVSSWIITLTSAVNIVSKSVPGGGSNGPA